MVEMSKEQLILECTRIMAPLVYSKVKDSYSPESKIFIQMCVSAGYNMAGEILSVAEVLEKKQLENTKANE